MSKFRLLHIPTALYCDTWYGVGTKEDLDKIIETGEGRLAYGMCRWKYSGERYIFLWNKLYTPWDNEVEMVKDFKRDEFEVVEIP